MAVLLIAIALVAGFLFTNLHIPARYSQKRSTGWNSYFHVASWGTLFGILSAIICIVCDYINLLNLLSLYFFKLPLDLGGLSVDLDSIKSAIWAVLTLCISMMFGAISKIYYLIFSDKRFDLIAHHAEKCHLDTIILQAAATSFPILITLKSRKCYVGLCYGEPESHDERGAYIAFLPLLSGYRDKDTLSLELTTNYQKHYEVNGIESDEHEHLCLGDFKSVIPKSELESLSFFDLETYLEFKNQELDEQNNGVTPSSYKVSY